MTSKVSTVNPHAPNNLSLISLLTSVLKNRNLILQLVKREVLGRYKGSVIGLAWSFVTPLFMLVVYTFVFSVIFKARWNVSAVDESKAQFAVVLFVGMIVLGLFNEVINRAPSVILANVNYVKKVVFPIEILPIVAMGTALFNSMVSTVVLLLVFFALNGYLHLTLFFLPIVLMPLIIFTLGLAWMLASIGVFLRDIVQVIAPLTTVLTFLSPVFYPVSAVPEKFQAIIMLNPLTFILEQARNVLVFGYTPNLLGLFVYTLIAVLVAWAGYAWFQVTRKGFADVL